MRWQVWAAFREAMLRCGRERLGEAHSSQVQHRAAMVLETVKGLYPFQQPKQWHWL